MEPLSTCEAHTPAPRTCEVADKPCMRRVSVLRPGCASGVVRFQRHLTRATAQPSLCFRPGVEPAGLAGVCCAHTGFPSRLPLPRAQLGMTAHAPGGPDRARRSHA